MNQKSSVLDGNPVSNYIFEMNKQIAREALRLKDMAPCKEFTESVETFYFVAEKLGTIEHEVALHKMDAEFRIALSEASDAWRHIWFHFRERRNSERKHKKIQRQAFLEAATSIREMQRMYDDLDGETDEETRATVRESLDFMKKATKDVFGKLDKNKDFSSWLLLFIDLQSYSIYVRYFLAKSAFFIFRHCFILIFSIMLFGVVYSALAKEAIDFFSASFPKWPWLVGLLTLLGYYIKKYIFDPKIKKIQTRLESSRLRNLSFSILTVRTMAIYTRALRCGRL